MRQLQCLTESQPEAKNNLVLCLPVKDGTKKQILSEMPWQEFRGLSWLFVDEYDF